MALTEERLVFSTLQFCGARFQQVSLGFKLFKIINSRLRHQNLTEVIDSVTQLLANNY